MVEKHFGLCNKVLEKLKKFENFRAALKELVRCGFHYAKRMFSFFYSRPFSFTCNVIVLYLFPPMFYNVFNALLSVKTLKKVKIKSELLKMFLGK